MPARYFAAHLQWFAFTQQEFNNAVRKDIVVEGPLGLVV